MPLNLISCHMMPPNKKFKGGAHANYVAVCNYCEFLGKSEITPKEGLKLSEWIDCEFDDDKQPIRDRIRNNISFHLGNNEKTSKLSEAASKLFQRDYRDMKQIFVPEIFLTKHPKMISAEELDKQLENLSVKPKDAEKWRQLKNTYLGEPLEKNLYEGLKKYFNNHR